MEDTVRVQTTAGYRQRRVASVGLAVFCAALFPGFARDTGNDSPAVAIVAALTVIGCLLAVELLGRESGLEISHETVVLRGFFWEQRFPRAGCSAVTETHPSWLCPVLYLRTPTGELSRASGALVLDNSRRWLLGTTALAVRRPGHPTQFLRSSDAAGFAAALNDLIAPQPAITPRDPVSEQGA